MIARRIKLAAAAAFVRLAKYLVAEQKRAWVIANNVASIRTAGAEMVALCHRRPRCKRPVYHLAISWAAGETPSRELMEAVLAEIISELKAERHMFVAVLHKDTDCAHIHILINRISTDDYSVLDVSNDWVRIRSILCQFESDYGFRSGGFRAGDGSIARRPKLTSSWGKPTFHEWAARELRPQIVALLAEAREARLRAGVPCVEWERLHELLASRGMEYRLHLKGGVIVDASSDSEKPLMFRASRLMRDLALPRLVQNFGPYEPPRVAPNLSAAYSRTDFNADVPSELMAEYHNYVRARSANIRIRLRDRWNTQKALEAKRRKALADKVKDELKRAKSLPDESRQIAMADSQRFERESLIALRSLEADERARLRSIPFEKPLRFRPWLFDMAAAGHLEAAKHITRLRRAKAELVAPLYEIESLEAADFEIDEADDL